MRSLKGAFGVFLALLVATTWLPAQTQRGSVSGVAVDASEAVIPGAKVVLKNTGTGLTREVLTNEQGYFYFDQLPPGTYSVLVSKEGFRNYSLESLEVRAAKGTDLGNVKLEVGSLAETVQVEASGAPLVESQSAQITSSFPSAQVKTLRQGFGGLDSLAILTPGVVPGMGNINSNGMQVAANGQRSRSTQFLLDGHQMNDITIGGPSFFVGNLDSVDEYQVVTNQFSAEYGRNLGATVSIITKGGTNSHHGSLAWIHRNRVLNSTTARQDRSKLSKPKLINNQWSVTAGGPVIKDRLFYYGSYQGERQPGAVSSIGTFASNRVMTPNGVNTLLARFPNSVPLQVYKTAGPLAVPDGGPSCVAGTTQTQTVAGVPGVEVCAPARTVPSTTKFYEWGTRVDYSAGRHNIFGRYIIQNNDFCCSGGVDGYWIAVPNQNKSVSVTYNLQLSPRMQNQFRFNYGRFLVAFEGANTEPIANVGANLTNFSMPPPWQSFGLATNLPQNRLLNSFQYQDNWSLVHGRHTLKAGIDLQRNYTSLFFLPFINGSFSFAESDLSTFVSNTPSQVSFTAGEGTFNPAEFDQFYFFQDDIRLRSNLTLNLGLRYENNGQPINRAVDEILKRESDPAKAFWLQSLPLSERTLPRIPNDNNNFAPRIGFAYTPRFAKWLFGEDRTVIRGGYGVAYELAFYNILLNMTTAAPRVFAFALTGADVIPVPTGAKGSDVASKVPVPRNKIDPRTFFQTLLSPNFHNPYGQNFSLGIQRHLGLRQVMEVRYVGTNGIGLFQSRNANPQFARMAAPSTVGGVTMPGYPEFVPSGLKPCSTTGASGVGRVDCNRFAIRERLNSARSNYHSLQVRYDVRNIKNQFTGGFSYTWSKGIDNVSEIFGFFGDGSVAFAQNPFSIIQGERGVSNQNLPQTLALHYIWEIPWLRSQQGFVGRVLGGWQVSGITTFLAGRPWTPIQRTGNRYCGEDINFNASFAGLLAVCRPFSSNPSAPVTTVGFVDSTGAIHRGSATGPVVNAGDVRFLFNDDNAVRLVTKTPFGVGRNNFRGDMNHTWDIAIDKSVKISERFGLRYRMTMINAFNHRNFGVPTIRADLGDFGIPERNDATGRQIRMGLWFTY